MLKEREPRYRDIRERLAGKARAKAAAAPGRAVAEGGLVVGDTVEGDDLPVVVAGAAASGLSGRAIPPRPRKKGKKR